MTAKLQILALCVSVTQAANIVRKDVSMSGMICGLTSQQDGIVVYPADTSRKYPVISYAHGFSDGGSHLDDVYKKNWDLLASAGYVIVAAKAGRIDYCLDQWKDQLHALEWAKTSLEVKDRIDWSLPAAIAGHSMGGRATVLSASQEKVKILNIGAAVAQHPSVNVGGCPNCKPLVPIMFTTGSEDSVVPPSSVKDQYSKTTGVPKAFVEIRGVGHHDCSTRANVQGHYVLDWLNCFIKKNSTACSLAQCKEPQSSSPTLACETKQMSSENVVV